MENKFTEFAKEALQIASDSAAELRNSYVGSEHILIGLAEVAGSISQKILTNQGVTSEGIKSLLRKTFSVTSLTAVQDGDGYSPNAMKLINTAAQESGRYNSKTIGTEHLLIALIKQEDSAAIRILAGLGANKQKIFADILVTMGEDLRNHKGELGTDKDARGAKGNKQKGESILEEYSKDLCKEAAEGKIDPIVGREDEVNRIVQILSRRTKNNPCLVGKSGVGKTAIAEALAQKIVQGDIVGPVAEKRVLALDLPAMVAGTKYRGEFEERVKNVIKEVSEDGHIILFMDEIHTMIGAGGAEGSIDAANILKPALARGEIQIIGATTMDEYRKYFEKDAALARRFQPIYVEEPTKEDTFEILKGLRPKYEEHHGVKITDDALQAAVNLSTRYINDRFLPDKAIDLIDEASSRVRLDSYILSPEIKALEKELKEKEESFENLIKRGKFNEARDLKMDIMIMESKLDSDKAKFKKKSKNSKLIVKEEDIADVVAKWTKIPVRKLEEEESKKLKNLEKTLHKRVIAQDEAITAVSKAIRRGRVGLKDPNKPIGSFLFLGPTGVGKTELSKALAETMFGSEDSIIRVDMSEYMEKHSVSKLIGSPPGYVGYEEGGQLSEQVRRHPYSIILFDEIEKAHPDVFNILLQVLDDGRITDAHGRVTDFKNTIIIMTSNAGAGRIMEPKNLGFMTDKSESHDHEIMKNAVMDEVKHIFKPEFINRIDEIIVFQALTKDNMKDIINIIFKQLSKRAEEQMQLKLTLTAKAKELLVEKGYDQKYGARALRRKVQSLVEDRLAEELLAGNIKAGDKVSIGAADGEINFKVKE